MARDRQAIVLCILLSLSLCVCVSDFHSTMALSVRQLCGGIKPLKFKVFPLARMLRSHRANGERARQKGSEGRERQTT